jgi:hypothetical protein
MQALEKIGVLEQDEDKGGRRITQSGQRDLDRKSNLSYGVAREWWRTCKFYDFAIQYVANIYHRYRSDDARQR